MYLLTYQYPLRFLFFSRYFQLFWCTDFSISCIQNWLTGFAGQQGNRHSVDLENVLETTINLFKKLCGRGYYLPHLVITGRGWTCSYRMPTEEK